ncbi:MAG: TonB-dependent receptor plug domain-containing protein, partial [Shinella sp.]|nr:TonB-dependent receptor plug domain-containing protein [Shinella sp.]
MRNSNSTTGQMLRIALLATTAGLGAMAWSAPALAQDDQASNKDEGQAIVITGSRIVRKDLTSNSPTVTVDSQFLQESSTSAIEQQLNKLPQFVASQSSTVKNNEGGLLPAGGDIQPNSTNTPGAATVSLRGVGANRTLVLIDGRRGTPGNASGTVDISTIPSSAIERVEVISGGASATYGADAVAGVTNFILKKNFRGLQLDANMGISQYGDGFEYQISGIMGTDFADGRGNVTLALSTNTRNASYERNRPWVRDRWADPKVSGNAFFIGRPGVALQPVAPGTLSSMFPGASPAVPEPAAFGTANVYFNSDGTPWVGDSFGARGGASALKPWPGMDAFNQYKITSVGTVTDNVTNNYLTVPLTRYNAYARGNYEINDWIGVVGQAMFSHTSTYTRQAPGNITSGWDANIPWGSGVYTGNVAVPSSVLRNGDSTAFGPYADPTPTILSDNPTNPAFKALYGSILPCSNNATGGCTNTQAFQQVIPQSLQTLLNNRVFDFTNTNGANGPVLLRVEFPDPRETFTDVITYNLVAGLEGSIPGT